MTYPPRIIAARDHLGAWRCLPCHHESDTVSSRHYAITGQLVPALKCATCGQSFPLPVSEPT